MQLRHASASVADDTLHARPHRFQRLLGRVGFLRQLIVKNLDLGAQGREILNEGVVQLLGDARTVGAARLELRAKAIRNLPEAHAMRAPACK